MNVRRSWRSKLESDDFEFPGRWKQAALKSRIAELDRRLNRAQTPVRRNNLRRKIQNMERVLALIGTRELAWRLSKI